MRSEKLSSTDTLLNVNPTGYTPNPYPDTESPLPTDAAGKDANGKYICGENPIPPNSDCRYVIVPNGAGSTTPQSVLLTGDQEDSYSQQDANYSTLTIGASIGNSVSVSFG